MQKFIRLLSDVAKQLSFFTSSKFASSMGMIAALIFLASTQRGAGQLLTVTTLAGQATITGTNDGVGNGAQFKNPHYVAVDNKGYVFVSDRGNHTIRMIAPNGAVTTVAGVAETTGTNDGNTGTAKFNAPLGIAVDKAGNIYVADSYNEAIRKITPTSTNWLISTIAGLPGNSAIVDGTNRSARFKIPRGIAVDNMTNLYVTDGPAVRRLTPVGTNWVVTTLAGSAAEGTNDGINSEARFSNWSHQIAVDNSTNLYVADGNNNAIRRVSPDATGTNWIVRTIAGVIGFNNDGNANNTNGLLAKFRYPEGIALDSANSLYVGNTWAASIKKVTPDGTGTNWGVTTVAGKADYYNHGTNDGTGTSVKFDFPSGVAIDSVGNLYIADANNHTIRVAFPSTGPIEPKIIEPPQNQTTIAGSNVTFNVTTTGTPPLSFQWRFNGNNLAGASGLFLSLTNVQPSTTGFYQVVVSNAAGAVTSAPVSLSILSQPVSFDLSQIQYSNDGLHLQINGLTGQGAVVIYASTNLITWIPIHTNPASYGSIPFVDSAATNAARRFYRAISP